MKNNKSRNAKTFQVFSIQKGVTFIELLIYMGILTIFMTVLAGLFGMTVDLQLEAGANTSLDRDAQYLFARMSYDLHRADSIVNPSTTGVPESSATVSISGVNHTYNLDGSGNLAYVNNLGTFALNSYDTKLSNLTFTRIGNIGGVEDTIKIAFTLTSVYSQRKGSETRNFETTIGLRR